MRASRVPAILFAIMAIAFLVYASFTVSQLPGRVASHFNLRGEADGWMSRGSFVTFTCLMSVGLPLVIVGLGYLTRFFPDSAVNLPNKEFWLSPGWREHTHDYITSRMWWLACLVLALSAGVHYLAVQANLSNPVRMPSTQFAVMMVAFLAGVGVWAVTFVRHFKRV